MANKLKDMFDESKQEYTGKVRFENPEKYNKFIEAIKKATEEGIPSKVDGVSGISVSVKDGAGQYPIQNHEVVTQVFIYPYEEPVEMSVVTDSGERTLKFARTESKEKIVLKNVDGKGALVKITYNLNEKNINVNFSAAYDQASTLDELIDYYNSLYFFTRRMFRTDEKNEDIDTILNHFISSILYFERLKKLSEVLKITIEPKDISKIDDEDLFIERVYFSLVENKAIRRNQKVTSMNNVHFPTNRRPGDDEPMIFTYLEQGRMLMLDKEIDIYIVSMAFNLIIDKEELEESGDTKLYFRDDDNNPMYIVSSIFLDEESAQKELENALNKKEPYINAKTLFDYIKESHDSYAKLK